MNSFDKDLDATKNSRSKMSANVNLLYWYKHLYEEAFADAPPGREYKVLEVGSGASPLKSFYPECITSDVLRLEHIDHTFDCHCLDTYDGIADNSINAILLVNVLHHLKQPLVFMNKAQKKLATNGKIILVEPYFSLISNPIFKYIHHELADFNIESPELSDIKGPLTSSNQAIPYMIFFKRRDWLESLSDNYLVEDIEFKYFTSLSYFLTGGISRRLPIPHSIYKALMQIDCMLALKYPTAFASFFVATLYVKP